MSQPDSITARLDRWFRDCAGGPGTQPPADERLCRVLSFASARLSERPDLDAIAAGTGVPRRTVNWLVRRHLACSLGELLTWLRLRRAMRLLIDTEMAVTDVALAAGFSSLNKMDNHFARYLGVSPRDYRASPPEAQNQSPHGPAPAPSDGGPAGKSSSNCPSEP